MMNIEKVTFPVYKIRGHLSIEIDVFGLVKVQTIKGVYILDDISLDKSFAGRRLALASKYTKDKIYKLKERVLYFRQLVKYRSGTTFIDHNGYLFKYMKSSKLYPIYSYKIINRKNHGNWTIIYLENIEIPFLIGESIKFNTTHASVMQTTWGPLLYDLTSKYHIPYRRKI